MVRPQPEDAWIRIPFPLLVSQEIWHQAQLLKKERTIQSSRNTKVFFLLQYRIRCCECNRFFGCRSVKRTTVRAKGKTYMRFLELPRRRYACYGMSRLGRKCRDHSHIPADRLEKVVVTEVRMMLQNPELILAGLKSIDSEDDGGLAKQLAKAEKDLNKLRLKTA